MTANPAQGLRTDRRDALRLTAAGRIALPLSVDEDGIPLGTTDLVMTYDDAVELHAELGRLITDADRDETP